MRRLLALVLALSALPGIAQSQAPACPTAAEVGHKNLLGLWRAEFEDRVDVIFERHPFGFGNDAADALVERGCRNRIIHDRLLIMLSLSIS